MSAHSGSAEWWTKNTNNGKKHIATKGVVQNSLIINLDASVTDSYAGTGTTWTNLANTSSNGTLQNSPTFSTNTFIFDGVNDTVALVPNFFAHSNSNSFTISVWFKTSQITGGTIFGQQNTNTPASASGWVPVIYLQSDGKIRYEPFWTGSSSNFVLSISTLNDNKWHNVIGTFASGTMKLYIDGSYQNQLTSLGQSSYANPYYYFVGAGFAEGRGLGTNFFSGSISRFLFYTRELSESEIRRNFNALRGRFGI